MGMRQGGTPDALKRKYDILRQKASQQGQAAEQEQVGALQRRFASLGNLSSGAAIKQEQLVKEQAAKQREEAVQNVDVAQAGEEAQQEQLRQQQEFAKAEREAGQGFAAAQAKEAQGFSAGEAEKQRGFQQGLADRDSEFRTKVFESETGFKQKELDMASEELRVNKEITAFNALAQAMESKDPGALSGALDQLNKVLGTGFSPAGSKGKSVGGGKFSKGGKAGVTGRRDSQGRNIFIDSSGREYIQGQGGTKVYR
jgi:hypothetical protein